VAVDIHRKAARVLIENNFLVVSPVLHSTSILNELDDDALGDFWTELEE